MKKGIIVLLSGIAAFVSSCEMQRELREAQRREGDVEMIFEEAPDEPNKKPRTPKPKPDTKPTKTDNADNSVPKDVTEKYAKELKTSPDKLENPKLYAYIDGWIGVKYKYAGNDKNGVDCSGFANAVYKDVYGQQLKRSAYDIIKQCDEIDRDKLSEGDFVFFDISSKNSHIGVYLANNKFVHASTSKGVIISDLDETYWKKYWGRAGRLSANTGLNK